MTLRRHRIFQRGAQVAVLGVALCDPPDAGRLPRPFARGQDRRWFGLRPVEPQYQIDRAVWSRQPVRFLVSAWRFVLDIERERPVGICFHGWQHRRVDQIAIDRVFDQQLRLAVVHGQRPEGIHRRQLPRWECQRVIVLAAVQGLTIAVGAPGGIHRLLCVVAVYSSLRAGSAFQPVAVEKSTIAEQRTDPPAVDRLAGIGDGLIDLLLTFLHAQADFELLLQRQVLEAEGFAGSDADTGELRAYLLLVLLGGS